VFARDAGSVIACRRFSKGTATGFSFTAMSIARCTYTFGMAAGRRFWDSLARPGRGPLVSGSIERRLRTASKSSTRGWSEPALARRICPWGTRLFGALGCRSRTLIVKHTHLCAQLSLSRCCWS
jgi:hypothetical protein